MINTMKSFADTVKEKKNRIVPAAVCLAVLLVIVLIPGRAWYRGYIAEQEEKTCRRARLSMLQVYERLYTEEMEAEGGTEAADADAGEGGDPLYTAERAADRFQKCRPAGSPETYDVAVQKTEQDSRVICVGPCLGQGTYTIFLDASDPEDPHKMRIVCSVHGDEVTLDKTSD